jgi:membrane-associated protein
MLRSIMEWLSHLSGPAVYAVVAALVFGEDALFFGFVLPGETAAIVGGVLANQGRVSLLVIMLVVVVAAIIGDSVGYMIGCLAGHKILTTRPLHRYRARIAEAENLVESRGGVAVFLGRFIAFFRSTVPALAGSLRMPYRTFLLFNVLGGVVWGVGYVLLGYLSGAAYTQVEHHVGRLSATLLAIAVVAGLLWARRRRRTRRKPPPDTCGCS